MMSNGYQVHTHSSAHFHLYKSGLLLIILLWACIPVKDAVAQQLDLPIPDLYWQIVDSENARFMFSSAYGSALEGHAIGKYFLTQGIREESVFLFDGATFAFKVEGDMFYEANRDISISAWIRPDMLFVESWNSLVEIAGEIPVNEAVPPLAGISITRMDGGKIALYNNHTRYEWPFPYHPGRWVHLAAVFRTSGDVDLYVNALKQDKPFQITYQTPSVVESTAYIGRNVTTFSEEPLKAHFFRGAVDSFYVFLQQFSEEVVSFLYHLGRPATFSDHFHIPGLPEQYWDIQPPTGFGIHSDVLHVTGYHGPNTLGATSPIQNREFSLWHRYNDVRYVEDIPVGDQLLELVLRMSPCETERISLRFSPRSLQFIHVLNENVTVLATATEPDFMPNTWYNSRVRVVGNQCAVWLRDQAGSWGDAVMSHTLEMECFHSGAFALTVHPGADYQIDNFHTRPYDGELLAGIDSIDIQHLNTSTSLDNSGKIFPEGGQYPLDESVHLRIETAPGFIFKLWDEEGDTHFYNHQGLQTRLVMDSDKLVTAKLRKSYNLPDAVFGNTHYDSHYAPYGHTNLDFSGLISTYEDRAGKVHRFVPAKVVLHVDDYPKNDPLRSLQLSEIAHVIDAKGDPILYSYPVGTTVHIEAYPLDNIMGFPNILMGWETTPGTEINQCPFPEDRHRFTIPPIEDDTALQFRLHAGMVGVEIVIPSYVRYRQTSGNHYLVGQKQNDDGMLYYTYHVFGPVGALQEMSAITLQFAPAYTGPLGQGKYEDLPRHGTSYRLIPFVRHGPIGDSLSMYKKWILNDACWAPIDGNPSEPPELANPALSPGKGLVKSSTYTPIVGGY